MNSKQERDGRCRMLVNVREGWMTSLVGKNRGLGRRVRIASKHALLLLLLLLLTCGCSLGGRMDYEDDREELVGAVGSREWLEWC
jgi:hypothetical protein